MPPIKFHLQGTTLKPEINAYSEPSWEKVYDLKIKLAKDEIEKQKYIKVLKEEFTLTSNKRTLLIIKLDNDWIIYGYDNKNELKEVKLESGDELENELNKFSPKNKDKITEKAALKIGHTMEYSLVFYGGIIVLSHLIANVTAFNRYNISVNDKYNMKTTDSLVQIGNLLKNNWQSLPNSESHKFLHFLVNNYSKVRRESEILVKNKELKFTLEDYHVTDYMTLLLFIYAHEFSHILFSHAEKKELSIQDELDADSAATRFMFTRIKGGWEITTDNGKIKSSIDPIVNYFRVMYYAAKNDEEKFFWDSRLKNFLLDYVYFGSYFNEIEMKKVEAIK